MQFEAYSYRTSARFGSRVYVDIENDIVSISGPRIGAALYNFWLSAQFFFLLLFMPVVILPIAYKNYIFLLLIIPVFLMHLAIGGLGAASLWEMKNLQLFSKGLKGDRFSFKTADAKNIKIGKGWARGLIWFVIPYFIPLVNISAKDYCVSFQVREENRDIVFALHMQSSESAKEFAGILLKNNKQGELQ